MKISKSAFLAMVLLLAAAPAAMAHHLWIEESGDGWAVVRGLISERVDAYDPARVREISAFNKNGKKLAIERIDEENRVIFRAEEDVALATAGSEWGYRVNTTRGKRLITREAAEAEGLRVLSAFFSTHYAKSLLAPSDAAVTPTGLRFEIVPLSDPLRAAPGDEIPCRILFDGKPLPGVSLHAENGLEWTANESGTAVVALPDAEKKVMLYARHRVDISGDEKKDYDIFTTFLTFEVNR